MKSPNKNFILPFFNTLLLISILYLLSFKLSFVLENPWPTNEQIVTVTNTSYEITNTYNEYVCHNCQGNNTKQNKIISLMSSILIEQQRKSDVSFKEQLEKLYPDTPLIRVEILENIEKQKQTTEKIINEYLSN